MVKKMKKESEGEIEGTEELEESIEDFEEIEEFEGYSAEIVETGEITAQ